MKKSPQPKDANKQKRPPYFTWSREGNPKLFPIDYTQQEFLKLASQKRKDGTIPKKFNTARLSEMLDLHPVRSKLEALLVSQPADNKSRENYSSFIPLEAEVLLTSLYPLLGYKKYKDLFENGKFVGSREQHAKFMDDLYHNLYKAAMQSSDYNNSRAFNQHVLFQDGRFVEVAFEYLWHSEIDKRYKKLSAAAKQASYDTQVAVLKYFISAQDHCILMLNNSAAMSSQQSSAHPNHERPTLAKLTKRLLFYRNCQKDRHSKNPHASYKIYNSELESGALLSDAFRLLNAPNSEGKTDLLAQARRSYMAHLAAWISNDKSDVVQNALKLEKDYNDIQNYLDITNFRISKNELKDAIMERCIHCCQNMLASCTYESKLYCEPSVIANGRNHNADLLSTLITLEIEKQLQCFDTTIQALTFWSAFSLGCQQQYEHFLKYLIQNSTDPHSTQQTYVDLLNTPREAVKGEKAPYLDEIQNFANFFNRVWTFLYDLKEDDCPIIDANNYHFTCKSAVANTLFHVGNAAVQMFRQKEIFASVGEVYYVLDNYERLATESQYICSPHILQNTITKFMQATVLLLLRQITIDTQSTLMKEFQSFPGIEDK